MAATGSPAGQIIESLQTNPLGTLQGEASLQTPFNATARRPNVYIVNHSRTKVRKVCKVSVSQFSGAEEALRYSKEYQKAYGNVANVYAEAKRRDMSIYEEEIKASTFKIRFDGRDYFIKPAPENDPDNPPVELVPDGVWDLYLGNFERMNPAQDTPETRREQADEKIRLAVAFNGKHSPVWIERVDGKENVHNNPFGYIELIREVPKEAPQRLDSAFVTASELIEE